MIVGGIGPAAAPVQDRGESRPLREREGGERFTVDRAEAATSGDERRPLYTDSIGQGRRRTAGRIARRVSELHPAHKEHGPEEVRRRDPEPRGGGKGGEEPAGERPDPAEGTAADFEALSQHLMRLGGPIREVTLHMPALGQVTARLQAGGISIEARVPRRLADAVRRGEPELRRRMEQIGLRVAHLQITPQDGPERERPEGAALPRTRPAHGLVDVMA
jgi:hypothetical protein